MRGHPKHLQWHKVFANRCSCSIVSNLFYSPSSKSLLKSFCLQRLINRWIIKTNGGFLAWKCRQYSLANDEPVVSMDSLCKWTAEGPEENRFDIRNNLYDALALTNYTGRLIAILQNFENDNHWLYPRIFILEIFSFFLFFKSIMKFQDFGSLFSCKLYPWVISLC